MLYRPKCDLRTLIIWVLLGVFLFLFLNKHPYCQNQLNQLERKFGSVNIKESSKSTFTYDQNMPLIFIGGMPRSGTTLMSSMLDAHPLIRCGEETHILSQIVSMRYDLFNQSTYEKDRLNDAGVTQQVIDSAVRAFILEVMIKNEKDTPYLCNKDPLMLSNMSFLKKVFPQIRFVFMIRDGRATVHSIISRQIKISGFNLNSYQDCLIRWNSMIENMFNECIKVGPESCLMVYYEQLVLHPEANLRRILDFLNIQWDDAVLRNEQFIGNEISILKSEKSSDQLINSDALSSWVNHLPNDVLANMSYIAPMLTLLGYDPKANPPDYRQLNLTIEKKL